jgi:hypothetical protein
VAEPREPAQQPLLQRSKPASGQVQTTAAARQCWLAAPQRFVTLPPSAAASRALLLLPTELQQMVQTQPLVGAEPLMGAQPLVRAQPLVGAQATVKAR